MDELERDIQAPSPSQAPPSDPDQDREMAPTFLDNAEDRSPSPNPDATTSSSEPELDELVEAVGKSVEEIDALTRDQSGAMLQEVEAMQQKHQQLPSKWADALVRNRQAMNNARQVCRKGIEQMLEKINSSLDQPVKADRRGHDQGVPPRRSVPSPPTTIDDESELEELFDLVKEASSHKASHPDPNRDDESGDPDLKMIEECREELDRLDQDLEAFLLNPDSDLPSLSEKAPATSAADRLPVGRPESAGAGNACPRSGHHGIQQTIVQLDEELCDSVALMMDQRSESVDDVLDHIFRHEETPGLGESDSVPVAVPLAIDEDHPEHPPISDQQLTDMGSPGHAPFVRKPVHVEANEAPAPSPALQMPESAPSHSVEETLPAEPISDSPATPEDGTLGGTPSHGGAQTLVITSLSILNWPLRMVPTRARPIVDWFALSLVFWVPVIWVLALFVIWK